VAICISLLTRSSWLDNGGDDPEGGIHPDLSRRSSRSHGDCNRNFAPGIEPEWAAVRMRKKDGNLAWIGFIARVVRDPVTGEANEAVVTMRDIPEQKSLEENTRSTPEAKTHRTPETSRAGEDPQPVDLAKLSRWCSYCSKTHLQSDAR
jgi:hypothetical protein